MKFKDWLNAFIQEKGINPEQIIEVQGDSGTNFMPIQIVLNHILETTKDEQWKIKDVLVRIDFMNGDVVHFLKHLAGALAI
jgi:hypothetical protein